MITIHQNKTHVYYRKDGNKLGRRENSIIQFLMGDLVFNHQIHKAIHTNKGYSK